MFEQGGAFWQEDISCVAEKGASAFPAQTFPGEKEKASPHMIRRASAMLHATSSRTAAQSYEVRPRKDHRGVT
jgi:hypothetical protein